MGIKIMGLLDKIGSLLSSKKKDAQILLVGLDNSGKSSIINYLKPNESKLAIIKPTVGFNTEKLNAKGMNLTIFDMSGNNRYRNLWEHYYRDVDAIVFVIDVADRMRVVVSKEELDLMLNNPELKQRNIPILFLANKNDLKEALPIGEIKCELELDRIKNKKWEIVGCSSKFGEGIINGFEWLAQAIRDNNTT